MGYLYLQDFMGSYKNPVKNKWFQKSTEIKESCETHVS